MALIPQGRYKARPTEAALGVTGTGKEQVAVALEISDGDFAGSQLTWYGYFTENTEERTFESLRHMGWSSDDLMDLSDLTLEVSIVVGHEDDQNGEPRARVKWINDANSSGLGLKTKLEGDAAKAFAARMKARAAASRQGAPPVRKPAAAPTRSKVHGTIDPAYDDEIPF